MRTLKTIVLLLGMAALGGCIKENRGDCPEPSPYNTEVVFSFVGDNGDPLKFAENISDVKLFVFDENDNPTGQYEVDKNQLGREQGAKINLEKGSRKVVCWGNAYDDTEVFSNTSFANSRVNHPNYTKNPPEKIPTNDALYYGVYIITEEKPATYADVKFEVPFRSAHIAMEVYVSGLGNPADAFSTPAIEVENLMPQYDFNQKEMQPYGTTYYPAVVYDPDKKVYAALFNTLRFPNDGPVKVLVKDAKGVLKHTVVMKEYIAAHPEMSVDGKNEARVSMLVTFNPDPGNVDFGAKVTVPDWGSSDIDPIKPGK